ncbi:hypothetical protein [Candidatus Viridilinea mediisalina]|uniref:Uncharacterized protein n=1 Tax=Candidatus Viridilinea mediisalina TaxID=2024553 RepID=A0A2A6RGW4_9CHLR|nr:hypothetical protein [Candidatus Viridilinea mediisalina]PDW02100.1 hypothetical protein CJ255_15745 [Candidatus Viridilinea mediisalina]
MFGLILPILPILLILLIALLLHWPYRWDRAWDFLGREAGVLQALLYRYEYGPAYDRLDYDGLRRLQSWLLMLLTTVAGRFQPEVIIWLIEALRRLFGF